MICLIAITPRESAKSETFLWLMVSLSIVSDQKQRPEDVDGWIYNYCHTFRTIHAVSFATQKHNHIQTSYNFASVFIQNKHLWSLRSLNLCATINFVIISKQIIFHCLRPFYLGKVVFIPVNMLEIHKNEII